MSSDDTFFSRTRTEHPGGTSERFDGSSSPRSSGDPVLARFGMYTPLPSFYVELLPELKPSEVVVMLVILRQTLGWVDKETGFRKEREWISQSQLARRTGLNRETVGFAVQRLSNHGLIRIETEGGESLGTPKARRRNQSRTYYRPMPPQLP